MEQAVKELDEASKDFVQCKTHKTGEGMSTAVKVFHPGTIAVIKIGFELPGVKQQKFFIQPPCGKKSQRTCREYLALYTKMYYGRDLKAGSNLMRK